MFHDDSFEASRLNVDQSTEHFSMDPHEQFAAIQDIRSRNWVLIGNFHSHPNLPAQPSQEDIRFAFDPEISYLILSLNKDLPEFKSFQIKNETVNEEELRLI